MKRALPLLLLLTACALQTGAPVSDTHQVERAVARYFIETSGLTKYTRLLHPHYGDGGARPDGDNSDLARELGATLRLAADALMDCERACRLDEGTVLLTMTRPKILNNQASVTLAILQNSHSPVGVKTASARMHLFLARGADRRWTVNSASTLVE